MPALPFLKTYQVWNNFLDLSGAVGFADLFTKWLSMLMLKIGGPTAFVELFESRHGCNVNTLKRFNLTNDSK